MSAKNEKGPRRLQLMPEVLPTPRASTSERPGPRERTLSRLSKLMAVAAAGAALAGCGDDKAASTSGPAPAGTPAGPGTTAMPVTSSATAEPTPSASASGSTAPATSAVAELPDAGADASDGGKDAGTKKAVLPPKQRDRGYQVVDMLPNPSRGGGDF